MAAQTSLELDWMGAPVPVSAEPNETVRGVIYHPAPAMEPMEGKMRSEPSSFGRKGTGSLFPAAATVMARSCSR